MAAGSLGGSLHALRSLWWYAGNRQLAMSWMPMYFLLPFGSGLLAAIVCLVLGAGFWEGGPSTDNVGEILAVAALVGLFSDEANQKLRQLAGTIFTPKEKGRDQAASPTKLTIAATLPPAPTANPAAPQMLTISAKGLAPPVALWVTDPANVQTVLSTTPTAGATDSFDAPVLLSASGSWTLKLTDVQGQATEDFRLIAS